MLVGIHTSSYTGALAEAPDLKVGRVFFGANKTADTAAKFVGQLKSVCEPLIAAGMGVYVSFKFPPADVTAGKCDTQLKAGLAYLQTLVSKYFPVYATSWHEPENDMSGKTFVAMYDHVYALKVQYAPDIKFGVVNMGYQWRNPRSDAKDWMSFKKADFIHNDVYSGNGELLKDMPKWKNWLTAVQQYSLCKTIGLAERGYNSKGDQVNVMIADFAYLSTLQSQGLVVDLYAYWDSMDTNGTDSYKLSDAAWHQLEVEAAREALPPAPTTPTPPPNPYPIHRVFLTTVGYLDAVVACDRCFALMGNARDAETHYKVLHP